MATGSITILKKWREHPARLRDWGLQTDWFETSADECVEHTERSGYYKPGSVLEMLEEGATVATPEALYRTGDAK